MPGMFEGWQDDHFGQRGNHRNEVRWGANSTLLSFHSQGRGMGDLLGESNAGAGAVEMVMCLLGPHRYGYPLCRVTASDSFSHSHQGLF